MSCRRESRSNMRGGDKRGGGARRGAASTRGNSNDVDGVGAEGNSRRSLLRRRRGMETGIRLVCEGRHSRGSPVPFGVCALPWSREKRFARFQRETREGRGEAERTWKILSAEGHRENTEVERDEEHRRPTNRRGLTDVATPYVTFIADALPLFSWPLTSLLLNGRKKRSRSFYIFYRCRIASYFSFFHFRHRAKYQSRDAFFPSKWLSMKERSIFLLFILF